MPTTISTFAASEAAMRYREPFTTDGLNRKAAVVTPAGVYRGFLLVGTGAGDRQMTIDADADSGDSVAVVRTQNGHALTVRKIGAVALDLTAYASQDVVVAIYAVYTVGSPTSVVVRVYTLAEYNALTTADRNELVVLGTVTVPAAATSISGNTHFNRRTLAWQQAASNTRRWNQLLHNGSFESSNATVHRGQSRGWELINDTVADRAQFAVRTTDPRTGAWALEAEVIGVPAGTVASMVQRMGVPILASQRLRVRFFYKVVNTISAGTATLDCKVLVRNEAGTQFVTTFHQLTNAEFGVAGGWIEVDKTLALSAGTGSTRFLENFSFVFTSTNSAWTGTPAIRIDDVVVLLEVLDPLNEEGAEIERSGTQSLEQLEWAYPDVGIQLGRAVREVADFYVGGEGSSPALSSNVVMSRRADLSVATISQPYRNIAGGIILGEGLIDPSAPVTRAEVPRQVFRNLDSDTYTLLSISGQSTQRVRVYTEGGTYAGQLTTTNARWNETTQLWEPDSTSEQATGLYVKGGFVSIWHKNPTLSATWSVWDTIQLFDTTDDGGSFVPHYSLPTGANLSQTTAPLENALYRNNIPKAWGTWVSDGVGGVTLDNGFNLSFSIAGADVRGTILSGAMANNDYAVLASMFNVAAPAPGNTNGVRVSSVSNTAFDLTLYRTDTAALESAATSALVGFVLVMGEQ